MGDKRTLTIVSVSTEPREWNGKKFWKVIDSDDVEWTVSDERIAEGLRKHKGDVIEFDVNVSTKGDRTNRFINGAPSVPDLAPERKPGGGGYRGGGRDYVPRSAISFAFEQETRYPSFALSYAHDEVVAGKIPPEQVIGRAKEYLAWMKAELAAIVRTAPVLDATPALSAASVAKPTVPATPPPSGTVEVLTSTGSSSLPAVPAMGLAAAIEFFGSESKFLMAAAKTLSRGLGKADLSKLSAEEIGRVVASRAA